jgi:transketolase
MVRAAQEDLDQLCINTIRMLAVDAVQKANSGHPGMPMDSAAMAYVLWTKYLRFNPRNPAWPNRDRFVLSAGHGSMLLYALLHLSGYDLSLDEIRRFRQWESQTPGHPEYGCAPGVETTTGPLGQGFANAVGMAIAEAHAAARFNRPDCAVFDHYTYVIASDGDLMEGVSGEAASLAGHLKLGKLVVLYSDNRISIEGSTDLAFTEDVGARFRSYDWQVLRIEGNDLREVEAAIASARADRNRPTLIVARTHLGYGSPNRQDTAKAHGEPLGEVEVALTKENLGWPKEPAFLIPDEALAQFRSAVGRGAALEAEWRQAVDSCSAADPGWGEEVARWLSGQLPQGWDADLPVFDQAQATRVASGVVLNALAKRLPNLMGGSADLAPSNNTRLDGLGDFSAGDYAGRNMHFGVREHAMGSILNGMALSGELIPFGGTFLIFSDYMRPAIRLAALMELGVIYVFTHDSIGLGEDGPTHQPVEQLASLRAIPHLCVIRPADANEVTEAWRIAVERRHGPTALVLTRQKLPAFTRGGAIAPATGVRQGAYVLRDPLDGAQPRAIVVATGSEVQLALAAQDRLAASGVPVRVVSMPSWELFDEQPNDYRAAVFPAEITARVAVEAGVSLGWERYVGAQGRVLAIERFGASAPVEVLMKEFGFTVERVVEATLAAIG